MLPKKKIYAGSEHLNVPLLSSDVERAHRIGKFAPNKKRPIIIKFNSFKTKERILSQSFKLKETNYAISQDYSASVRIARAKLVAHGRSLNCPFKLRYDKLYANQKCFVFDDVSGTVTEMQR